MLEAESETPNSLSLSGWEMQLRSKVISLLGPSGIWCAKGLPQDTAHAQKQSGTGTLRWGFLGVGEGHTGGVGLVWGRNSQADFVWSGTETHRQVLCGRLGQVGVLRLHFPTCFRGKPHRGQPRTPAPGARFWADAHPCSCPALLNRVPHLPSWVTLTLLSLLPSGREWSEGAIPILMSSWKPGKAQCAHTAGWTWRG